MQHLCVQALDEASLCVSAQGKSLLPQSSSGQWVEEQEHALQFLENATHPCPCGFYGDTKRECRCSPRQVEQYRQKISGPLLDRIDLHVEVPLIDFKQLSTEEHSESSATVRERVMNCRKRQQERFVTSPGTRTNSDMGPKVMRAHCTLDTASSQLLEQAMEQLSFSARAHDRILKVARTIADLAGYELITADHLLEAIQYRSLDRKLSFS